MTARRELIERLDENSIPEPMSGCHLWTGSASRSGNIQYGVMRFNGGTVRAHRASYEAHNGNIPKGLLVCHRCDQGLCINPDHLFLGSSAENNRDRRAKRRDHWFQAPERASAALAKAREKVSTYHRGSALKSSKLTEEIVAEMRRLNAQGVSQGKLAKRYGVTQGVVSLAVRGITWTHVRALEAQSKDKEEGE